MNLKKYIYSLLICVATITLVSCEKTAERVVYPYSCPEMSGFSISIDGQMTTGNSLYFSVNISDPLTPLSTLEVAIVSGEEEVYSESIRTKGMSVDIDNHEIYLPFEAGQEDNRSCQLSLTAINVEGSEQTITYDFVLKRPSIPSTLYLHYNDIVIPMTQQTDNPYEYATEVGEYPETFTGRISTSSDLSSSEFIWGYCEDEDNMTELISETGAGFSFNYTGWEVEQVVFNVQTFRVTAVGTYQVLTIKGVELSSSGGIYSAVIAFDKGETVEMTGFDDLEGAYNRDFFEYDAQTGTCTFIQESGEWEVYYSPTYNYIWVARMDDVAPDAFWLVGHGFIEAPVWPADDPYFTDDGWDTESILHLGYIVKIGENKYQTTIYMTNQHAWDTFEIEIYSDREWGKDDGMLLQEGSITGDSEGIIVSVSDGFTSDDDFVPGYFRLTFDTSGGVGHETMNVERLGSY